jgi:hypothetical protein
VDYSVTDNPCMILSLICEYLINKITQYKYVARIFVLQILICSCGADILTRARECEKSTLLRVSS